MDSKAKKAEHRAVNRYQHNNYDKLCILFSKEEHIIDVLNKHCVEYGYIDKTLNAKGEPTKNYGKPNRSEFVRKAIQILMQIDKGEYEKN